MAREMAEIRNSTKKRPNSILAIPAAAPAIPEKPSTAAIIAIAKNVIVQFNIVLSCKFRIQVLRGIDFLAAWRRDI